MRASKLLLLLPFLYIFQSQAQQTNPLTLQEAVSIALLQSDEVNLANTRAVTRNHELETLKNNRYPDVKVSGQYLRLANADVNLKSTQEAATDPEAEPAPSPKVNRLMLGQANVNMPIFSGFKLKNSIIASENLYKAELSNAGFTKEQIALRVVHYYADLYKAQKSVELFRESLKSSQQRVTDFIAMEKNGLIPRNDLLRAQLQLSNVQLSLDEAEKNVRLVNYYLITLLKLSPDTQILVTPESISKDLFSTVARSEADAIGNRKDFESLQYSKAAADANIKVAKSGYFPSLAIVGGYTALDLQNVVTVQNAMNLGVGVSYNLSSIFKNKKDVDAAKSRALELEQQQAILADNIRAWIVRAREDYDLSVKQSTVYNEAVTQADENYRIVKDKYENGLANTNDLLEADVEDLSARINQAYADANRVLKYYELLEAAGQLTESFNLTQK
ncbi:MAG TPA: TolC family protein [Flavobacterium sp.]|jgi:outer membrane protein TolC